MAPARMICSHYTARKSDQRILLHLRFRWGSTEHLVLHTHLHVLPHQIVVVAACNNLLPRCHQADLEMALFMELEILCSNYHTVLRQARLFHFACFTMH